MTRELKLIKQNDFFLKKYVLYLKTILKTVLKGVRIKNNDLELKTTTNNLGALLYFLQKHTLCQYSMLLDIACVDVPGKARRFTVSYLLFSLRYNARVTVIVKTNEVFAVPSMVNIYRSANWLEREVWDLYGVFFDSHPDLRRILTDYGFSGHPLRKDFPLTGFFEVYYNDSTKRLSYEPVELAQEYRTFTLQSPWNQNYQKEMALSTSFKLAHSLANGSNGYNISNGSNVSNVSNASNASKASNASDSSNSLPNVSGKLQSL